MVRVTCRDIAFLPVDTTYIIGTGFSSISSSNWWWFKSVPSRVAHRLEVAAADGGSGWFVTCADNGGVMRCAVSSVCRVFESTLVSGLESVCVTVSPRTDLSAVFGPVAVALGRHRTICVFGIK